MTTDSHDNKLYKQQIVRIIVSPIYCWLLRLASKEPEYAVFLSCLYSLTAAQPCKVGRDEYDRTDIGNYDTAIKKEKSCGGDSSLHPQDLTLSGQISCRCTFAR
ncbi:hypothetical protein [Prevotella sp.]